jgi:hypothetical protein
MIVWGGVGASAPPSRSGRLLASGAAYDPATDRWRRIAPAPLRPRRGQVAVWTGDRMIVWGGEVGKDGRRGQPMASDGAIYDPRRDSWRRMRSAPIRSMPGAQAVWTGGEMLVWVESELLSYRPESNRWERPPPPPWNVRAGATAAWSGEELILWGGVRGPCGDCYLRSRDGSRAKDTDGVAFSPGSPRRWRLLPRSPLAPRDRHVAVGLGAGKLMVWGGCCAGSRQRANGAIYRPGPLIRPRVGRDLARPCRSIEATVAVRCPTWLPAPATRHRGAAFHLSNADFDRSACGYLTELHSRRIDDASTHPHHVWFGGRCRRFALRDSGGRWPPRPNERDHLGLVLRAPETPGSKRRPGFVRPRVLAVTSVRGRRALLLAVDPFPRGGLHGGHYAIVWNEGGDGYALSLHYPRGDRRRPPLHAQVRALTRAAASMRPAALLHDGR